MRFSSVNSDIISLTDSVFKYAFVPNTRSTSSDTKSKKVPSPFGALKYSMSTDALSGVIRIVIPADTSISPSVIEAENISVFSFICLASVTISAIFLIPPVSSSAKVFCAVLTKITVPAANSIILFFMKRSLHTLYVATFISNITLLHYTALSYPYYHTTPFFAKILRLQISYSLQHVLLLTGFF